MDAMLGPRESGAFIAFNSEAVVIKKEGILKVAMLIHESVKSNSFDHADFNAHDVHVKTESDQHAIDWIFFVDTINFSFWSDDLNPFIVTYNEKSYTGYFGACACVNRALDENIPVISAEYMANVSAQKLSHIFRSDSVQCEQSAQKLLHIIVENFYSYRDYATFQNQKVSFLKRAQILVSDIYSCLHDRNPIACLKDIGFLTMFADYRVPQVLAYLGVFKYSPELLALLRSTKLVKNGSEPEVVLRGFSIYACDIIAYEVEFLRRNFEAKNAGVKLRQIFAVDVDMFLWIYRRNHATAIKNAGIPYHRVRCIYY